MKNSPLNELTAQDIARKQKKLDRIDKRIERKDDKFKAKVSSGKKGTDMDITRHERSLSGLKERKHKTEHQIKTGERGRPTSLKNEAWLAGPSRKPSSPVNNLGFTMPHSPLNQNDSIAAVKAWQNFKQGYAKVGKVETGEYDREKHEFYYDTNRKKLRLVPTDDAERQDEGFKGNLKKWQLPPLDRKSPLNQNEKVYNMTPNVSEKEAAGVREKFDRTYMKRGSHAHADSEFEKATYQLMNEGVIKETDNKSMPLIEKRMKENKRNK